MAKLDKKIKNKKKTSDVPNDKENANEGNSQHTERKKNKLKKAIYKKDKEVSNHPEEHKGKKVKKMSKKENKDEENKEKMADMADDAKAAKKDEQDVKVIIIFNNTKLH